MVPARAEDTDATGPAALERACAHALRHNLGLRPGERVVVVTDAAKLELARCFEAAARRLSAAVTLVEIPIAARNGEQPGDDAARAMLAADVALLPLTRSISWTRAREEATRAGVRIASMPGITPEIILRTFETDYRVVRERVNRLADRLDAGAAVRVTSEAGTDLRLNIAGREAHGRKGGIYREPGHWGNLPCGEAFVAPREDSAEGVYVVDASHGGVGKLDSPIRVEVRSGAAVAFDGGAQARRLAALLDAVGDRRAFNVAELGIGCNPAAAIGGVTMEDEKALGTCHIALGSNSMFGGTVRVASHLDGVLRRPTIRLDGTTLIERGEPCGGRESADGHV